MKCPYSFKFIGTTEDYIEGYIFASENCLMSQCAWWTERFGMCCQAVDAYLKGQEDRQVEREYLNKEISK